MKLVSMIIATWCAMLTFGAVWADVAPSKEVLENEASRIAVVEKISRVAVAIFDGAGQGGGSGVLVSADGFALTNFHVVAPCGAAMKCGLSDGNTYDAVVVGVDPVGDVALIQLLGRDDFPVAELGDSDQVRTGDWAFTVGNPFLLADDFHPSVSYGLISGVHRYQYPAGTLLEYADCLQTDAAINPGNSGGGLFDEQGRLIGINGRGSFEKRGRVNVGVGYAISINQIKRFLPLLKSGRIVDHASLGFTVSTSEIGRVVVDDILETSAAYRRGLRYGDEIIEFAGREISTANTLQTALGPFPRDWTVPLTYQREGKAFHSHLRLPGVHDPAQLVELIQKQQENPLAPPEGELPKKEEPKESEGEDSDKHSPGQIPDLRRIIAEKPKLPPAVQARYEEVRGYANYWYNRQRQQQLWDTYRELSQLIATKDEVWDISGTLASDEPFQLSVGKTRGEMRLPKSQSGALFAGDLETQLSPPGSGGLLLTLHLWQRMLEKGLAQFGEVYYLGQLPFGITGELTDCLVGIHGGVEFRLYFTPTSGELAGLEMIPADDSDPCEVWFSEVAAVGDKRLPHQWQVRFGDSEFADLRVDTWKFESEKNPTPGAIN